MSCPLGKWNTNFVNQQADGGVKKKKKKDFNLNYYDYEEKEERKKLREKY